MAARLHDLLAATVDRRPNHCALVAHRQRFAYTDIERLSDALAGALIDGGVKQGDRVVIMLENGVQAVIAFWATLKAGAIVCPINPLTPVDKLDFLLRDSGAEALIIDASLVDDSEALAAACGHLGLVVSVGTDGLTRAPARHVVLEEALGREQTRLPEDSTGTDDLAAILYTSGSTGVPKGVMMTHRSMLAAVESINAYLQNREDDVILCCLPMAFDYGLYQMILAFAVGARLVLERPGTLPQALLVRMRSEKVSVFPAMPMLLSMMEKLPARHLDGLEGVRYVSSTGAHLAQRHIAFVERVFPNALIYSMFGLTECKRCTFLPPEYLHLKPGSVGIAIPNMEVWVADAQGRRAPLGQTGELVVRGPTLMRGYWNDPASTAARLRPHGAGDERVLYTGDLCRTDEDGFVYFVSRIDELIKSRGYRVAPKEIESVLLHKEGVIEAAVIGVPDEVAGNALKAFVVLADDCVTTEAEILAHCGRHLEAPMVPAIVEFRAALPRAATGKIDRAALSTAQR
jgi:amino acid adenylation domain-containing protein